MRMPWNPVVKPWERSDLKASEIIAGALEFWGKGGERWIRHRLGYTLQSGCFYGGLNAAAGGHASATPRANHRAYRDAERFILDELDAQGYFRDIVQFNDHNAKNFAQVRTIACGALKRALAHEAASEIPIGTKLANTESTNGASKER